MKCTTVHGAREPGVLGYAGNEGMRVRKVRWCVTLHFGKCHTFSLITISTIFHHYNATVQDAGQIFPNYYRKLNSGFSYWLTTIKRKWINNHDNIVQKQSPWGVPKNILPYKLRKIHKKTFVAENFFNKVTGQYFY